LPPTKLNQGLGVVYFVEGRDRLLLPCDKAALDAGTVIDIHVEERKELRKRRPPLPFKYLKISHGVFIVCVILTSGKFLGDRIVIGQYQT
jgi:hypothetical protein